MDLILLCVVILTFIEVKISLCRFANPVWKGKLVLQYDFLLSIGHALW